MRQAYPVYRDVFFYNPEVRNFLVKTLTGKSLPSNEPVIQPQELTDLLNYLRGNV
jgi:hypothetical protein